MKYNKSDIMKKAWTAVKSFGMTMSNALKYAWALAKNSLKQLHMKEWFANKVANEIRCNLHTTEIFAVIRETEKAVYAMLAVSPAYSPCVWIPKSCIEECAGSVDFHTRFGLTINQAKFENKMFWASYC